MEGLVFIMSKNQRLRQRAQRREKRQIQTELLAQAINLNKVTPVPRNIYLPGNFHDYAINETKRDIEEQEIGGNRRQVLEKAIMFDKKIRGHAGVQK